MPLVTIDSAWRTWARAASVAVTRVVHLFRDEDGAEVGARDVHAGDLAGPCAAGLAAAAALEAAARPYQASTLMSGTSATKPPFQLVTGAG